MEPRFNGVDSRNNLPEMKYEPYVINLDEYKLIGIHCTALQANGDKVTYLDSFGYEYMPKKFLKIYRK